VLFPVVRVALWATGGAGSYMELMLFPAVLFSAWFQRPLYAWLLNGELVLIVGVSLLYDPDAIAEAQPARVVAFAATAAAVTWTMQAVEHRMLEAEATWTTSRASTTCWGMPPVARSCVRWRAAPAPPCVPATWWRAWAGTSSRSSSRT